jgi:putative DNA methylase
LPLVDARGAFFVKLYGINNWGQIFSPRQMLSLMQFTKAVRLAYTEALKLGYGVDNVKAIISYLAIGVNRLADFNTMLCTWKETAGHTFSRQALPMTWDFSEVNPFSGQTGSWSTHFDYITAVLRELNMPLVGVCKRGSASQLPFDNNTFDCVITDPPYYDNVPYSDLSDFFYIWLKRSVGYLYPEHFSSPLAPKKQEAIMDAGRHARSKDAAMRFYEDSMAKAFSEAGRVLKPGAPLVIVYAHKTTVGWATLVDALRNASFMVTEAWPLDTEMGARLRAMDSAALASSIFLVARRRDNQRIGPYENDVKPDLERIVRERVENLWAQGVTGADLVIACVGAGLRAFTKYASVEYANGSPVPANTFLSEVEGAVLEALLEKLFGVSSGGFGRVDAAARFYILWRFAYGNGPLDAGEAIVFAYPQRVELDGAGSLTHGSNPLVRKEKGKYTLLDFTARGDDEKLGLLKDNQPAPMMDVLHRLLWLVENEPRAIPRFLDEARPDLAHLRLVAQTLAGQTLAGNGSGGGKSLVAARGAEASALRKLTANWRTLVEQHRGTMERGI